MLDLISREAAIDVVSKSYKYESERMTALQNVPTIDAVPVVHGEWKYYKKQGIAVCTHCSFERNLDDNFGKAVACPNCGADMRKGGSNA